jgi:GNAT superfamily N-acetyltransferase
MTTEIPRNEPRKERGAERGDGVPASDEPGEVHPSTLARGALSLVEGQGVPPIREVNQGNPCPLVFVPYQSRRRGLIAELLASGYAPLLGQLSAARRDSLRHDWAEYDDAVHDEPETIGRAGFFSLLGDQVIGFASWDPRGWPDVGTVGHNCVLPEYQGRGFGRCQIEEVLGLFRRLGFARARVRTDEHLFFEPARRMYRRCGFELAGREPGVLVEGSAMLVYEQRLRGPA